MSRKKLNPVTIWGIEFDALIEETKSLNSTVPSYPVEKGFPVSDTIINQPPSISMVLYVSNTPVTWKHRHKPDVNRVKKICSLIEKKWFEKKLAKIVTTDTIYTNMGITSISTKRSKEIGYAREISISASKVYVTGRKKTKIPSYILKSGKTKANAGKAQTSSTSAKTSSGTGGDSTKNGNSGGTARSEAKKKHSILYGIAKGLKFMD